MKSVAAFAVLALLLAGPAAGADAGDRTITQVVKLLQSMMDKSKADGDRERELFSKHKCYCDTHEAEKTQEIASLTEEIGLLENDIDSLQASSALLSKEVAKLDADMTANQEARAQASGVRAAEHQAFLATEADLTGALGQMRQAIDVLSAVGADQTLGHAAADHEKFMARYQAEPSLLTKLRASVKQALVAASAVVSRKQAASLEAFLQAPFTGTYSAQSGEVVGILKDMRDTFERNLASARAEELAAQQAHAAYMASMQAAYDAMRASYESKQGTLSANDSELATQRAKLQTAEADLAAAEAFLAQLRQMCAQKAAEYRQRTLLRTNEEAAIAEAISILNSDAAFATFGTVDATSTGPTSLLQRAVRKHLQDGPRQRAEALLRGPGLPASPRLARVAALLQAGNPFAVVLAEVQKMVDLIAAEEVEDDRQLAWCQSERATSRASIARKNSQITALLAEIGGLTRTIEDPQTGLKALIQADEESLRLNRESQTDETKARREENVAYQQDVENLVEAARLLEKAIEVLKRYYSRILAGPPGGAALLAVSGRRQPAPPATWQGPYKGQSEHGGTDAVSMLEFILGNTKSEEQAAHQAEEQAQHSFEDGMQQLKDEEARLEASLASLRLSLAQAEQELLGKQADRGATGEEKAAIEAYLLQIKPGCDFITQNIGLRKANRQAETQALHTAAGLIRGTPAFQEAVAAAHNATLGGCLGICAGAEEHVDCKACLAHVSVPGYCAGHPGTLGC